MGLDVSVSKMPTGQSVEEAWSVWKNPPTRVQEVVRGRQVEDRKAFDI